MMFNSKDMQKIDKVYFNVIRMSEYDIEIQSENTGHVWLLHSTENEDNGNCIIFHKHNKKHPYHRHGSAGSMATAVRNIKSHDKWQLAGRK